MTDAHNIPTVSDPKEITAAHVWWAAQATGSRWMKRGDWRKNILDLAAGSAGRAGAQRVNKIVAKMSEAGLIESDQSGRSPLYRIRAIHRSTNMHKATPARLRDGTWGARIEEKATGPAVNVGDLVSITTRRGRTFDPRTITAIEARFDGGVVLCRTEEIGVAATPAAAEAPTSATVDASSLDMSAIKDAVREAAINAVGSHVDRAIASQVEQALAGTVDAVKDEIAAQVESAVKARTRPEVLEIRRPDGEVTVMKGGHYMLPRLIQLAAAGIPVFLWGEPGTGKTTAGEHAAQALGLGVEIDTLDPTTMRSMVQGFINAQGDAAHTAFSRAVTDGKVYIADEIDAAPAHVQNLKNSTLANRVAPLAWGNTALHDSFVYIGTGNTPGRPTRGFPERRPMSQAFADRLYFMHWPLDPAIEDRAAGLPPSAPPPRDTSRTCTPEQWVKFVRDLRDWARREAPTLHITPRASLLGIQALALGETPDEVADGLIFRGCDAELRAKALANVKWETVATETAAA